MGSEEWFTIKNVFRWDLPQSPLTFHGEPVPIDSAVIFLFQFPPPFHLKKGLGFSR
jgi:hypothetical protein